VFGWFNGGALIITFGIKIDSDWVTYKQFAPFDHWEALLQSVEKKDSFFVALLFFGGLGVTFGAWLRNHCKIC
jgi:hypothetical protein